MRLPQSQKRSAPRDIPPVRSEAYVTRSLTCQLTAFHRQKRTLGKRHRCGHRGDLSRCPDAQELRPPHWHRRPFDRPDVYVRVSGVREPTRLANTQVAHPARSGINTGWTSPSLAPNTLGKVDSRRQLTTEFLPLGPIITPPDCRHVSLSHFIAKTGSSGNDDIVDVRLTRRLLFDLNEL